MPRRIVECRIPWPRGRRWRPGEPITLESEDGAVVTYRLRGVMHDHDPVSEFATVRLEPLRNVATDLPSDEDLASAAG